MASKPITLPPYQHHTQVLGENNRLTPDAHRSLLLLYNAHPLIPISTAAGAQLVPVPLAKWNQGVEITYVKTSADANIATLAATGSDTINGAVSLAMGAAQFSRVKLKSDGVSNWYVTG